MEVIQEQFHLPVAILMWPWSTRWQVQIMETGVGVLIVESWVCHLASSDLAKCPHPLCTLVLPVCFLFGFCTRSYTQTTKGGCVI